MSNFIGHPKPQSNHAPSLVVMRDRIIIQEHHHGEINRYMWEGSNIADHYSKMCLDFNNCESEQSTEEEVNCNNNRP